MQGKHFPATPVCSLIIVIVSFLPWGHLSTGPSTDMNMNSMGIFRSGGFTLTLTGWNGQINVLGIVSPNWLVVVVAILLGILSLIEFLIHWKIPSALTIILAAFGTAHLGFMIFVLRAKGNVGIGGFVAWLCFISILVVAIAQACRREQQMEKPLP